MGTPCARFVWLASLTACAAGGPVYHHPSLPPPAPPPAADEAAPIRRIGSGVLHGLA